MYTRVDEVLDTALESGLMILKNGGETYRSEEAMISIATSLGAQRPSAFVTPTVVMLTCFDTAGHSHTRIQRVTERTINLGIVARVNALARRLKTRPHVRSPALVASILDRIQRARLYTPAKVVFATALSGFCFSLLFRGTLREAAASFVIGAVLRTVLFLVSWLKPSSFVSAVTGGAVDRKSVV